MHWLNLKYKLSTRKYDSTMILCILWLFIKSEESERIMLKKIPIFYFIFFFQKKKEPYFNDILSSIKFDILLI